MVLRDPTRLHPKPTLPIEIWMSKRFFILVALTIYVVVEPVAAQRSRTFAECNQHADTAEAVKVCADEAFERSEVGLKNALRAVLKAAGGEPNGVQRVKDAEAAWERYRDAYVEARYPATDKSRYGSRFALDLVLLRARLNNEHAADLKLLTEQ